MRIGLILLCAVLGLLPLGAAAQSGAPVVHQEIEETSVVPGQSVVLRLTVLVPTFMPQPPQFPSFETPNLMVRLPERSTSPTTERIEGEAWSGVVRSYRITPLVAGQFEIPSQSVTVTYRDPDGSDDLSATLQTEPLTIAGVVPDGAADLDPFLAADSLTMEQEIVGNPDAMAPGDALVRTITVSLDNAPALMIPDLLGSNPAQPGLSIYPEEPVLEESDNRGELTGKRSASVTYIASGGGTYSLPEISLQWFNLTSGAIETATVPGIEMTVDGPALSAPTTPKDWRAIGLASVAALILLALVVWGVRRLTPLISRSLVNAKARRLASEPHAWSQVINALAAQNLTALNRNLRDWQFKAATLDGLDEASQQALEKITSATYGSSPQQVPSADWQALAQALKHLREGAIHPAPQSASLQMQRLNP